MVTSSSNSSSNSSSTLYVVTSSDLTTSSSSTTTHTRAVSVRIKLIKSGYFKDSIRTYDVNRKKAYRNNYIDKYISIINTTTPSSNSNSSSSGTVKLTSISEIALKTGIPM